MLKLQVINEDDPKDVDLAEVPAETIGVIFATQAIARATRSPAVLTFQYKPEGTEEGSVGAAIHPDFKDWDGLIQAVRDFADHLEAQKPSMEKAGEKAREFRDTLQAQDEAQGVTKH